MGNRYWPELGQPLEKFLPSELYEQYYEETFRKAISNMSELKMREHLKVITFKTRLEQKKYELQKNTKLQ